MDWCILRTSGRRTLRLADSLCRSGIEAWTPAKVSDGRIPTRRARIPAKEPIMPSFVFARASAVPRLLLAAMYPSPHPSFSLFRHGGRVPLVAEADLAELRAVEESEALRARRKEKHCWRAGQLVRVREGPAEGMTGMVERANDSYAFVCFGGRLRIKIASFLLVRDGVPESGLSELDMAA